MAQGVVTCHENQGQQAVKRGMPPYTSRWSTKPLRMRMLLGLNRTTKDWYSRRQALKHRTQATKGT